MCVKQYTYIYAPTALINNDYWQNVRKSSKIILLPWCVESIVLIKVLINIEYRGSQGDVDYNLIPWISSFFLRGLADHTMVIRLFSDADVKSTTYDVDANDKKVCCPLWF